MGITKWIYMTFQVKSSKFSTRPAIGYPQFIGNQGINPDIHQIARIGLTGKPGAESKKG